jgi:shikimate 5-dehydrogenase
LEWLKGRDVPIVEELELMAYRAAVDFHFWTEYEPSIELIRESLEEYLQW